MLLNTIAFTYISNYGFQINTTYSNFDRTKALIGVTIVSWFGKNLEILKTLRKLDCL